MKTKILCFLMILACVSCAKDEVEFPGSITGCVTDAVTGEPLQTAHVVLTPGGASTTTGSDGTYEYKNLTPGQYNIQVSKAGYVTETKHIDVPSGETASGDIVLQPLRDIALSTYTLNFGKTYTTLSFEIKNNGSTKFNWSISGLEKVEWLEVSPLTGSLEPGKSNAVNVVLLRDKLTKNEETSILINANNESVALRITADATSATARTWASYPESIDFGAKNETSTLSLYSYNGSTDYTLSTKGEASWLRLGKTSGTIAQYKEGDNSTIESVALTVDRTALAAGSYECVVVAKSDLGELQIPVKMTVASSGTGDNSGDNNGNGSAGTTGSGEILTCDSELQFTFNGCTISGTTATINYTVVYTGAGDKEFGIYEPASGGGNGYVFDDLGNEYYAGVQVSVGTSGPAWRADRTIPSGVPVKCSIVVKNVDANASSFPAVKLHVYGTDIDDGYLRLKNVAIEGRSKYSAPASTVEGGIVPCDADLQFAFANIVRTATTVTINYMVTYTGISAEDMEFGVYATGEQGGYMYDSLGNEYSAQVSVGCDNPTWRSSAIIPSGVPVKCSIVVKNVNADVSMFSAIKLKAYGTDIDEPYLEFHNVKI